MATLFLNKTCKFKSLTLYLGMETLKVDVTKLMTIRRYAQMLDVSVQAVYNWAKDGKINIREIDGVKFVQL
jgi:hypothetical protein